MVVAVVRDLYFYPIKSFRGIRAGELTFEPAGPKWDRAWALVDKARQVLTQRQMPELARIGVSFHDDSTMELSLPGKGGVDFGLEEREGPEVRVRVWRDEVPAYEVSSEVSQWLSAVLRQPVMLVRMSQNARRLYDPSKPDRPIRFVDTRPALVISTASLRQLEELAGVSVAMSRFRPNIVVDEVAAHAEDTWTDVRIGTVNFKGLNACTRCKLTTVHPLTGATGEEPLKTLATYRRTDKGIVFGYHFGHLNEGVVRRGDAVRLGGLADPR